MYRKTSSPQTLRKFDNETLWKVPSTLSQEGLTSNREWNDDPSKPPPFIEDSLEQPKNGTYTNDAFICEIEIPAKKLPSEESVHALTYTPANKEKENVQTFGQNFFHNMRQSLKNHSKHIKLSMKVVLFLLYNVYFGFAVHSTWNEASSFCDGIKFLTVIMAMIYAFAFYSYVFKTHLVKRLRPCLKPLAKMINKLFLFSWFARAVWSALWGAVLIFLILDTYDDRYRLVSAAGLTVFIFLGYVFSKHRRKIVWRHLLWGIFIQFCIGLLILRWSVGKDIFHCLGAKVKVFLDITDKGSSFVFGYLVTGSLTDAPLQPAVFAFKVLSVIIFFSFIVSLLYYYGVMQVLVMKVGWLLQHTIGTTACESMNAAGNIFLGMTEAPLLIRPYLPLMTKSELHAVMTGGFATIAGSVLAAYINFGINASHLLSASVMAAPAALAFSKLVYPETEESRTQAGSIKIEKGSETNALEAATNGASTAIKLVSNIAANLIAFVAFIALLDTLLSWMGSLVNWDFLSFEWVLSKVFVPVSLLMGVDWKDKEKVANLVGLKTVVNEFVAYKKLADYQKDNQLSARSEAIATFALCGFSNISSIGIQIGALSAMAPERKSDLAQIAVRAMITGTATCFVNACIAGTLLQQ